MLKNITAALAALALLTSAYALVQDEPADAMIVIAQR